MVDIRIPLCLVVHSRDISEFSNLLGIVGCEVSKYIEVDEKAKNNMFSGAGGKADKLDATHPTVEAFHGNIAQLGHVNWMMCVIL